MQNVVDTLTRRLHRVEVEQVSLAKVDLRGNVSQIFPSTGFEIVEAADLFAAPQQCTHQGRANEPCRARDKILRHR